MGIVVERVDPVFEDDSFVLDLVRTNAPYWSTMKYLRSPAHLSVSQPRGGAAAPAPRLPGNSWFRGDWAYAGQVLVPGAERLLHHEPFVVAARRALDGALVRPQTIYVNLNTEGPDPDAGHRDVPMYRGIDRNEHGVTVCHLMLRSGLFERWRVRIATAVSWFSDQTGGGFVYWPDGPDHAPHRHGPPFRNTSLVSDNEAMYHHIEAIGSGVHPEGLSPASVLELDPDRPGWWRIRDEERIVARYPEREVRISVSWKGLVFDDEADAVRFDEHTDDLTIERVGEIFFDLLRREGALQHWPDAGLDDPVVLGLLNERYPRLVPQPA
jgi:hypothetical protein